MTITDLPNDYYERLGVARTATPEQIKKAWRNKAPEAHPDRGGSEEQFVALQEAYDTLCDPDARKRYDRGERPPSGGATATPRRPHEADDDRVPAQPYVTPNEILWTIDAAGAPEPVTVRLSNRGGGAISKFGPVSMAGDCWQIEGWSIVMDGDDLADYVFAPAGIVGITGTRTDNARFFVDDEEIALRVTLAPSATATSPGTTKTSPAGPDGVPSATAGPRLPRTRLGRRAVVVLAILAIVIGAIVALKPTPAPESRGSPQDGPHRSARGAARPQAGHSRAARQLHAGVAAQPSPNRTVHVVSHVPHTGAESPNSKRSSVPPEHVHVTAPARPAPPSSPTIEAESAHPEAHGDSAPVEANSPHPSGGAGNGEVEASSPGGGR